MSSATAVPTMGIALIVMMLIAAGTDLHRRDIPNLLNLAIALAAPVAWWALGLDWWPAIAIQVAIAGGVFALFAGLFYLGAIGGGDVKMIGALLLSIHPALVIDLLFIMSIVGGSIAAVMLIAHRLRKGDATPEVPYGVAIAAAGIWAVCQQYINHLPVVSHL